MGSNDIQSPSLCFESVTNVGNRPTSGPEHGPAPLTVESHLLNFHPIDLTEDTPLELGFLHRLRPEIRFPSPEALRTQIGLDVHHAQRFFALARLLSRIITSEKPTYQD